MDPEQSSVSRKSPTIEILLTVKLVLPVLVTVTVWGLLEVCTGWLLKASVVGATVKDVCGTPLSNGTCHIPRPYVPTRSQPPPASVAVRLTAGAMGKPVPRMFQHWPPLDSHVATFGVTKTPPSEET